MRKDPAGAEPELLNPLEWHHRVAEACSGGEACQFLGSDQMSWARRVELTFH